MGIFIFMCFFPSFFSSFHRNCPRLTFGLSEYKTIPISDAGWSLPHGFFFYFFYIFLFVCLKKKINKITNRGSPRVVGPTKTVMNRLLRMNPDETSPLNSQYCISIFFFLESV